MKNCASHPNSAFGAFTHFHGIEISSLIIEVIGRHFKYDVLCNLFCLAPDKPVPARIILTLSPQDNSSASASRQIVVREGDNVTLFCIMEGAPPPEVHTHPHNAQNNRYVMDQDFGKCLVIALCLCSFTWGCRTKLWRISYYNLSPIPIRG